MEINWIIISIVPACVIVLFIFLINRNAKDEKDLSKLLDKNDDMIINKDDAEFNDVQ